MVFENVIIPRETINNIVLAAFFIFAGIILSHLWKRIITKFARSKLYPWVRKSAPASYRKIVSIITILTIIGQWIIILLSILQALAIFKIYVFDQIVNFGIGVLPKLGAAFLIILAGLIFASIISKRIENKGLIYSKPVSSFLEIIIILATVLSALEVLDIKVTAFFYIFVIGLATIGLAIAIALGVAFGSALKPEVTKLISQIKKRK